MSFVTISFVSGTLWLPGAVLTFLYCHFQVYAYTDSNLQVALLGLFTELLYRFPNLVVGVMTRDSVRQAFRGGITADQIISYLEQHAHPNVSAKNAYMLGQK